MERGSLLRDRLQIQLMNKIWLMATFCLVSSLARAQLLSPEAYRLIRENASGQRPIGDFRALTQFSGFAPSAGADQIANYLLEKTRDLGLVNTRIERFPSDGKAYIWAFRTEPYWEAHSAELWLEQPHRELLASFAAHRVHLARLSHSTNVSAPLVDVGTGMRDEEYAAKKIQGMVVLANGSLSIVLRKAVWERKALGVVIYKEADAADYPDLVGFQEPKPWEGPRGEQMTFGFNLSNREGQALRERLAAGEALVVHAEVKADLGKGEYPEVLAEIPGREPNLPAVLVYAHTNDRNAGGGNNLTGVGCTLEVARVLNRLVESHKLERPRRTIRFMWGPEHFGIISYFHAHPEEPRNILVMINVDMIGYDQAKTKAVAHLFRAPYSRPTFLSDVVQNFVEQMGTDNTISIRHANLLSFPPSEGFLDPTFDALGSRSDYRYNIERFWGPSDHEDASEGSIGIPAVFLGDFPDVFLGTQADTPEVVDPTQMRRGVIIAAASAYAVASATAPGLSAYIENALAKAKARLADNELRAHLMRRVPQSSYDALRFLRLDYDRESQALESLAELVTGDGTKDELSKAVAMLREEEKLAEQRLHVRLEMESRPSLAGAQVPSRNFEIRGPVNFYRPEYGRWWLTEKTGNEAFDSKLPLARRGHYVLYEALNFVNGKRTISEIRDLVSDEYEPIPVEEFSSYFQFLQSVGVVTLRPENHKQ
jgi:aminopeptidase YwaD